MEKRPLGESGLYVSPLCFGGNVFGWTADDKTSFALLDAFTSAGGNFVDTADVYSAWIPGHQGGESETIIGNWFKTSGRRSQVVLATKSGFEVQGKKGLSRAHIIAAAEGSLKRLQTDYIDLYYAHTDDMTVPQEETLEAYQQLIRAGKVRTIGASNFTAARLTSALDLAALHGLPAYSGLQPEYNLYDRAKFETDLQPLCLARNIGAMPYYGLARGFLSGKYRSDDDVGKSTRGESVRKNYFNERGWRILAALDRVSAELDASPARIALAWLMAQPAVTAALASATSLNQLQDLVEAVRISSLPDSAMAELSAASAY